MTRARALKHAIRTRAAKTGERYTTARRHVLGALARTAAPATRVVQKAAETKPATTTRGSVSDAAVLKKTGHGLAHWFAVLDRFGGVEKGHSASARHLFDTHGVGGWYSQGITVAYERARGVRGVNQRCDGDWEVSVSKVITASMPQLVRAFTDARTRAAWIANADPRLAAAFAKGLADKASNGIVVRPDGLGRFRYKWDGTTVQFYMEPRPKGKVSVVVQHTGLADREAVEVHRGQWKTALAALAAHFTA